MNDDEYLKLNEENIKNLNEEERQEFLRLTREHREKIESEPGIVKVFLTDVLPGLILIFLGIVFFVYFIDFRRVTGVEWLLSGILLMLILIYFKKK